MKNSPHRGWRVRRPGSSGFTVVEVMVASAVLILILGVILNVISQTSSITRRATEKISSFQGARSAFDIMTRTLSQATLNSYWDYVDANGRFMTEDTRATFTPARYGRRSELHFRIGAAGFSPFPGTRGTGQAVCFQVPSGVTADLSSYGGLENLLNAAGYFIEYADEGGLPTPFPVRDPRYRFRLMQAIQPAEALAVYNSATAPQQLSGQYWIQNLTNSSATPPPQIAPLAENIILLIAWPRMPVTENAQGDSLTTNFTYNTRTTGGIVANPQAVTHNQLPPLVQLTMVALDEPSAQRICTSSSVPSEITTAMSGLFTTSTQDSFDSDLQRLEQRLVAANLNYRIFTAMVPIRESKMQ